MAHFCICNWRDGAAVTTEKNMKISDWLRQKFDNEQMTDFEILELENKLVRLFVKMVKSAENQEKTENTGMRPNQKDI